MKKFLVLSFAVVLTGNCMPIINISTGEIVTPESLLKMHPEMTNNSIDNSTSEEVREEPNEATRSREKRYVLIGSDMTDKQRTEILAQMENLRKNAPLMRECINKFNADYAKKMEEIEARDLYLSDRLENIAFKTYILLDEYFKNIEDFLQPTTEN